MDSITREPEEFKTSDSWNPYRQERWAAFALEVFGDELPQKIWEFEVAAYLFGRDYQAISVRAVLEFAALWGTVELSRELQFDANDRAAVERLLPGVPSNQWEYYDYEVWVSVEP